MAEVLLEHIFYTHYVPFQKHLVPSVISIHPVSLLELEQETYSIHPFIVVIQFLAII